MPRQLPSRALRLQTYAGVLAALPLLASGAAADTLTFEADDGIRVVRWIPMFGSVSVELLAAPEVEMVQCVALDDFGDPIAATVGFPDVMVFSDLEVDKIADVACRQN